MSDDIAIKVSNLSKCYQIYGQPHDRLKQSIYPRLQRLAGKQTKQYFREFWALKDVSFEIKKGETVGIIGCNGCGKSTLLQMICGTLNQTNFDAILPEAVANQAKLAVKDNYTISFLELAVAFIAWLGFAWFQKTRKGFADVL